MDQSDENYVELPPTEIETVFTDLQVEAASSKVAPVFICEFTEKVSPTNLFETVFTRSGRYDAIAFPHKISSEDEYYQVNAVLGIEDGAAEKLNAEVCPEWMRVYVYEDANVESLVSFFTDFAEEHKFTIVVAETYLS